ncbi:MAG TPA: hypothetical protein VIO81_09290 [Methyloversatilis sp.]
MPPHLEDDMPMLDTRKLQLYARYGGDIDVRARMASAAGKAELPEHEFRLIDELLMQLATLHTGLASTAFADALQSRIEAVTADDATRAALHALATAPRFS